MEWEFVEEFVLSSGLRQGDPLSSYLFVLGMEKLGHLIKVSIDDGSWESMTLSRRGPNISHLFFADDLLLFGRASVEGDMCLRHVLDRFCGLSEHKVNNRKTQVFFSRNVKYNVREGLCATVGFHQVTDLGKYIGM